LTGLERDHHLIQKVSPPSQADPVSNAEARAAPSNPQVRLNGIRGIADGSTPGEAAAAGGGATADAQDVVELVHSDSDVEIT
jgi:hypothetical protein